MTKETDIKKLNMEARPYDKVLEKVMELCPAAVQNGKVDFERLKAELSDVVDEDAKETYEFKWVGKNKALVEANKPIRKTLRPCKEESKNWDTTENLYIEGDNLEALKLLQEGYLGKIKMIYIDPPYNTGSDFVYHDNRVQSKEEMNEGIGLFDEEGNRQLSTSFVKNTETSGRFHSDWCTMMYPRLKLARDLLSDDGVIFISIDDNEVDNMRKICDEVFGENNFVLQITNISNPRGRQTTRLPFALTHEYILIYAKQITKVGLNSLPYTEEQRQEYNQEDEIGRYRILGLRKRGTASNRSDRPNLFYPIFYNETTKDITSTPQDGYISIYPKKEDDSDGVWRWQASKVNEDKRLLLVKKVRRKSGIFEFDVFVKDYMERDGEEKGAKLKSVWNEKKFNNENGTECVKNLFNGKIFDFPKPMETIKELLQFTYGSEYATLDFFSGSATTAHAVMQLNAEDGGKRKFIMVQLPEICDEKSEAYKAGYQNICEIGKERIRRAGDKIVQETGKTDLDIGFRVLKVDETNMQDVYYNPAELTQKTLLSSIDNIKTDRQPLDLLFGVMVDWGVPLTLPLQEVKVGANTIHVVGDNDLVACFDNNVTTETITKMAELNPIRAVFRDACFAKDDAKINMFEIFKTICHWDDKKAKDNIRVM